MPRLRLHRVTMAGLIAFMLVQVAVGAISAGAQAADVPPLAHDGRGLFRESPATRAAFAAHWGDRAEQRWVEEHNMALSGGQPTTGPRIVFFSSNSAAATTTTIDNLVAGLRELGRRPGQNVRIDWRFSGGGRNELLPGMAADIVRLAPDVIVTAATVETLALKELTSTLPVVFASSGDPVGFGLVKSFEQPGGNFTGGTTGSRELNTKRLSLLKDATGGARRLAVLTRNPDLTQPTGLLRETQAAAVALGVELDIRHAGSGDALETAFAAAVDGRAAGLLVIPDPLFIVNRPRIVELAARHRLTTMHMFLPDVEAGGLMAYIEDPTSTGRRTAGFVHKILEGARPADLPVQEPREFQLVVNLRTAGATGFTFPADVLAQATTIIR